MIQKVRETIRRYGMFEKGQRVLVAVSGGVDSTVLVHVLRELEELDLELIVCHLNHGLRGAESMRDFRFVKELAEEMGLGFRSRTLGKGELKKIKGRSLQDIARERRRRFLLDLHARLRADRIATGHNLDDQAETVFMRFVKGSGLKGLSGMAPVSGPFARPLIEVKRAEIEEFARNRNIEHVTDSTNLDTRYLRNRLRIKVLPLVRGLLNPAINETIARTAALLRRDEDYLGKRAEKAFNDVLKRRTRDAVVLDRPGLLEIHEALRIRIFLMAVEALKGSDRDIYSPHMEAFLKILSSPRPNAAVRLPHGLSIVRCYDEVSVTASRPRAPRAFDVELEVPGSTVLEGAGISFITGVLDSVPRFEGKDRCVAYFDLDSLKQPLRVRTFKPGDRMRPLGMKGRKKLKDIFMEKRIPPGLRRTIPLLCAGEKILWAVGVRQSEDCKVKKSTKRVLRVECRGLEISGRQGGCEEAQDLI